MRPSTSVDMLYSKVVLRQHHDRDQGDRFGHRRDAENSVGSHRRAISAILIATETCAGREIMPALIIRRHVGAKGCSTACCGCFAVPTSSTRRRLAGMMQRRSAKASRNAGIVATVSARALIVLAPNLRSLAQCGTRPQRSASSVCSLVLGLKRTVSTGSVGDVVARVIIRQRVAGAEEAGHLGGGQRCSEIDGTSRQCRARRLTGQAGLDPNACPIALLHIQLRPRLSLEALLAGNPGAPLLSSCPFAGTAAITRRRRGR